MVACYTAQQVHDTVRLYAGLDLAFADRVDGGVQFRRVESEGIAAVAGECAPEIGLVLLGGQTEDVRGGGEEVLSHL